MKTYILSLTFIFVCSNLNGQNKNDWFIIGESGINKVNTKNKLNFGIGAEYYITKTKSFTLKLKYFKNGVDYFKKGSSTGFAGFFSQVLKDCTMKEAF